MILHGKKLLFIGYGDIAHRSSSLLLSNGFAVTGLSRNPKMAPHQKYNPLFKHKQADVFNVEVINTIAATPYDAVVITLTPCERSDFGYKKTYVDTLNSLKQAWAKSACPPKYVIFVSSTSVYAQSDNQWVNEQSQTQPESYNGKRLLEAENIARKLSTAHGESIDTSVVRFSGIYGPGRHHLLKSVISGDIDGAHYTNRIHVDDCAGMIAYMLQTYFLTTQHQKLLLVSDSCPEKSNRVKKWLAAELSERDISLKAQNVLNKRVITSKRCDNSAMLKTGYILKYPNYKAGFKPVLDAYCKNS